MGIMGQMEIRITETVLAKLSEKQYKSNEEFKILLDAFENKLDQIVEAKIVERLEKNG